MTSEDIKHQLIIIINAELLQFVPNVIRGHKSPNAIYHVKILQISKSLLIKLPAADIHQWKLSIVRNLSVYLYKAFKLRSISMS